MNIYRPSTNRYEGCRELLTLVVELSKEEMKNLTSETEKKDILFIGEEYSIKEIKNKEYYYLMREIIEKNEIIKETKEDYSDLTFGKHFLNVVGINAEEFFTKKKKTGKFIFSLKMLEKLINNKNYKIEIKDRFVEIIYKKIKLDLLKVLSLFLDKEYLKDESFVENYIKDRNFHIVLTKKRNSDSDIFALVIEEKSYFEKIKEETVITDINNLLEMFKTELLEGV